MSKIGQGFNWFSCSHVSDEANWSFVGALALAILTTITAVSLQGRLVPLRRVVFLTGGTISVVLLLSSICRLVFDLFSQYSLSNLVLKETKGRASTPRFMGADFDVKPTDYHPPSPVPWEPKPGASTPGAKGRAFDVKQNEYPSPSPVLWEPKPGASTPRAKGTVTDPTQRLVLKAADPDQDLGSFLKDCWHCLFPRRHHRIHTVFEPTYQDVECTFDGRDVTTSHDEYLLMKGVIGDSNLKEFGLRFRYVDVDMLLLLSRVAGKVEWNGLPLPDFSKNIVKLVKEIGDLRQQLSRPISSKEEKEYRDAMLMMTPTCSPLFYFERGQAWLYLDDIVRERFVLVEKIKEKLCKMKFLLRRGIEEVERQARYQKIEMVTLDTVISLLTTAAPDLTTEVAQRPSPRSLFEAPKMSLEEMQREVRAFFDQLKIQLIGARRFLEV